MSMEVNEKSGGSQMQQAKIVPLFPEIKHKSKMNDKVVFNFHDMAWENLSKEQVKFWEECYPLVDVVDALTKRMPAWLDANPDKAHKKNWKRFIVNWLSRQQERYEQFRR